MDESLEEKEQRTQEDIDAGRTERMSLEEFVAWLIDWEYEGECDEKDDDA